MEIKINVKQILKGLYVLSWIIFIGLCIEAGGFIFNSLFARFINPIAANNFWNGIDLSNLYEYDSGYFFSLTIQMSIVAILKAIIFYLILKIVHDKKVTMSNPFNKELGQFIFNCSYLVFGIAIFSFWGAKNIAFFRKQGIEIPSLESLHLSGAEVWLFMGIVLFVIAQVFKRGIEIQSENELTI
jgi:hypothetical protein